VRKSFGFNDATDKLLNERIEEMKKLGAVIIESVRSHGRQVRRFRTGSFALRIQTDLNAYLAGLGPKAPVHS